MSVDSKTVFINFCQPFTVSNYRTFTYSQYTQTHQIFQSTKLSPLYTFHTHNLKNFLCSSNHCNTHKPIEFHILPIVLTYLSSSLSLSNHHFYITSIYTILINFSVYQTNVLKNSLSIFQSTQSPFFYTLTKKRTSSTFSIY